MTEKSKPKKREIFGDPKQSLTCSICHETKPLTTEFFWIYKDKRNGPKILDNVYFQGKTNGKGPGCKACYKLYRKRLARKKENN
ncbi:MAG: hypothetical protein WCD81_03930 [Candidatus Bathyarchaeia archaeon]